MCADEYKWSLSFSSDCKENLFDSESCNVRKQCSAAPTLTPVTVVQCRHARDVWQCNLYLYFPAFVHHKFVSGREDLGDQTENLGDQREEDWAVSWGGPKLFLTKISPRKYMHQKYFWKNIYVKNISKNIISLKKFQKNIFKLQIFYIKHCIHVCCSVVTHGISAQHSEHFTLTRGTIQAASKVPLSTPHRPCSAAADCGLRFLIIFSLQQRAKCILNIRADVSSHEPFGQIRGKRCLILWTLLFYEHFKARSLFQNSVDQTTITVGI